LRNERSAQISQVFQGKVERLGAERQVRAMLEWLLRKNAPGARMRDGK
jgi:hypothetical protein